MSKHIFIIEDEIIIAENYMDAFRRYGYTVSHFTRVQDALQSAQTRLPDLALIDIGLGDDADGGFTLCRELRHLSSALPIIFLTARTSEFDIVSGLRLGADDYLTKDVSIDQIMARVQALFRRVDMATTTTDNQLKCGDLEIDVERISAKWKGRTLDFTVTEFWIIYALARHPGHVKNRQQLMDAANVVLDDNTITSHVKRIRKKFNAIDSDFNHIQTAYGMGYRWAQP